MWGCAGSDSHRVCIGVEGLVRLVECLTEVRLLEMGVGFGCVCRKFENSTACLGQCQWPECSAFGLGFWFIFFAHNLFGLCVLVNQLWLVFF